MTTQVTFSHDSIIFYHILSEILSEILSKLFCSKDLIADAVEDLTNFLLSRISLSDMRLEALQHVSSASAFRSQMVGLSFWTYGIHTFVDGWAGWSLAKSFIDTRPKNGAPGYDVAAIFVKEDQCAMVFSGTSGLADITTDFTFNVFHPRDYLPCGLHGVHEGFFNDVQQFMLTLILFSTGPV